MKKILLLSIFTAIGIHIVFSQQKNDQLSHKISITLQVGHQRIGFPFKEMLTQPRHFYVGLGAERVWKTKRKHHTYQTLNVGLFKNSSSGNGYFMVSNYGYQYQFNAAFFASGEAGLGFTHVFRPKSVYKLASDGNYQHILDMGKIHPDVNFNLRFGYQPKKVGIYLNYNILGEFLFNWDSFIYPQSFLSAGIRYKI